MRALAGVATILVLMFGAPTFVHGAPDETPEDPDVDEKTKLARIHFKNGVKLYRDTNYPGALAEFEAAYGAKPGSGSLQNVALCQKALFRYAEAAETLEQLLNLHAADLSAAEVRALKDAVSELKALVGSIVLDVRPNDARLTVNGKSISPGERAQELRLNVGEHTVVAEAPGYARYTRTLRIAGGQTKIPVTIELKPTSGFLSVIASDPQAAIAIDGVTRAFHRYRGPVEPGESHLVQVFRDGFESFETTTEVELGRTTEILADLGPALDEDETEPELVPGTAAGDKKKAADPRGYYGLLALSAMRLGEHPLDLNVADSSGSNTIGALGVRGGYRFFRAVAAELMLDYGAIEIKNASNPSDTNQHWNYDLASTRLGANLRFMTAGTRVRFTSTVGTGAVHHRIELKRADLQNAATTTTRAVDPYFSLELGIQFNFGHMLAEAAAFALIDGVGALQREKPDESKPFSTGTLPMVGLGLRGGWSSWKP